MTDFDKFLSEVGLTHAQIQAALDRDDPAPYKDFSAEESRRVGVSSSPIHGVGVFAKGTIEANAPIALAHTGAEFSAAGRYVNHAAASNARAEQTDGGQITFFANRAISPGEEITVDYRDLQRIFADRASV